MIGDTVSTKVFEQGGLDFGGVKRYGIGGTAVGFVGGIVLPWIGPLSGIAVALGVLLAANGAKVLPRWQRTRKLERTPIASLSSTTGAAQVAGTAVGTGQATTAPFSGEECLAYLANVDDYVHRRRTNGSGSYEWRTQWYEHDSHPFLVEDETGAAYVDPTEAEYHLSRDYQRELEEGEEPPAGLREAVEALEIDAVSDDQRRYREFRLHEGDEVHVTGATGPVPEGIRGLGSGPTVSLVDGEAAPIFSISNNPETDLGNELLSRAFGGIGFGLTLIGVGVGIVWRGLTGGLLVFVGGISVLVVGSVLLRNVET